MLAFPQPVPMTGEQMSFVQIAYVSRATRPFGLRSLRELASDAAEHNAETGVTGALCYADGTFAQVLEGPAEAVDAVLERIAADSRHETLVMRGRRVVEERAFGAWSMRAVLLPSDAPGRAEYTRVVGAAGDFVAARLDLEAIVWLLLDLSQAESGSRAAA